MAAPDLTTPGVDTRVVLAPELAAVVNGAIAEMDQMIQRGQLQNDPLRFPIAAEQVFLRAFYQVALDLLHRITAQQGVPLAGPDKQWGHVAIGATGITGISRRTRWRTTLLAGAGLTTALGVGAAGGWWWRGSAPTLLSESVTAQNCEHKSDGSVLCWVPYWQVAPSLAAAKPVAAASQ